MRASVLCLRGQDCPKSPRAAQSSRKRVAHKEAANVDGAAEPQAREATAAARPKKQVRAEADGEVAAARPKKQVRAEADGEAAAARPKKKAKAKA